MFTDREGMLAPAEMARLGWPHQSWMSPGLRPAVLTDPEARSLRFVHHQSRTIAVPEDVSVKAYGHTLWIATGPDSQCVALSFDWAVIAQHVFVIADPFRVSSNLWPVDEAGVALAESDRFRILNTIVWALDWQSVVIEHVEANLGSAMSAAT